MHPLSAEHRRPLEIKGNMNMATLSAWRGTAASASSRTLHSLQYKAMLGKHIVVPIGGTADTGTVLPTGCQIIFDFGCHWEGEIRYRPGFDDSRMKLRGTELPPFSGELGYIGGVKLNVLVQHHGLCQLLSVLWPEGQARFPAVGENRARPSGLRHYLL
jgi:hypothetical protein